ncbi:MAG: hypothetical protein WKF68_03805 [Daejeonella sp.]
MANLKNNSIAVDRLAKVIAVCMIIFHLVLMALGLSGQTLSAQTGDPAPLVKYSRQVSKVRSVYNTQLGVREKGVNSGTEIEKYLRYVNLAKGNPWCAAFVCWVFGEAGIPNPRSGWSPDLFGGDYVIWEKAESLKLKAESGWSEKPGALLPPSPATGNRQLATGTRQLATGTRQLATDNRHAPAGASAKEGLATPTTADIFALYFPEKGRIAHVGFVDEWNEPWVVTVEGNTNVLGSREGDGVYRKRRLTRSVYKVARFID